LRTGNTIRSVYTLPYPDAFGWELETFTKFLEPIKRREETEDSRSEGRIQRFRVRVATIEDYGVDSLRCRTKFKDCLQKLVTDTVS
jgi:hypothetical protein